MSESNNASISYVRLNDTTNEILTLLESLNGGTPFRRRLFEIQGIPGIGKTSYMNNLATQAKLAGYAVCVWENDDDEILFSASEPTLLLIDDFKLGKHSRIYKETHLPSRQADLMKIIDTQPVVVVILTRSPIFWSSRLPFTYSYVVTRRIEPLTAAESNHFLDEITGNSLAIPMKTLLYKFSGGLPELLTELTTNARSTNEQFSSLVIKYLQSLDPEIEQFLWYLRLLGAPRRFTASMLEHLHARVPHPLGSFYEYQTKSWLDLIAILMQQGLVYSKNGYVFHEPVRNILVQLLEMNGDENLIKQTRNEVFSYYFSNVFTYRRILDIPEYLYFSAQIDPHMVPSKLAMLSDWLLNNAVNFSKNQLDQLRAAFELDDDLRDAIGRKNLTQFVIETLDRVIMIANAKE